MAKTLEAHDRLLEEIFEGNYKFEIPDYQRPYSWTTEQTEDLINDLLDAMKDAGRGGALQQYFLGSIVLIKKDREPKSYVVDGQQRLSTLTILFSALRESLPGIADEITSFLCKKGKTSFGEKDEYRLTAREEDAEFFRSNIQEPGGILSLISSTAEFKDSHLRFRENAELLVKKLSALSEAERLGLWRFLVKDCSLVVISTPDLDAAYRIFSILNNRGLELAPIDILKAEILGAIKKTKSPEDSKTYVKKWSEMEKLSGREAFGELFAHIRMIYAKRKQQTTLMKEFPEYVTEYNAPAKLIDDVIAPYSKIWNCIRNESFEATSHADEINEYISWLNRVAFKDWVPPALVYFAKFRNQSWLLAAFLRSLERFTYYMFVTKQGINERITAFSKLTGEIENETFSGEVSELKSLMLDEQQKHQFREALSNDIYTKLPKARVALLLRLEALKSDGSKKQQFNYVSVEHVLPQTPDANSKWMEWFPKDEDRLFWTHRLANIVPLHIRKNPAASNYEFDKKKDVYFKGKGTSSPFILVNALKDEDEWTPEKLQTRQQELTDILFKHWDIAPASKDKAEAA